MKPMQRASMLVGALAGTLVASGALAETTPKPKMTTEIPPGIAIPDKWKPGWAR